jgi:hypothetical protein
VTDPTFDTFVCVHQRDVGYLLEVALRSYEVNFQPKGRLFLITNDVPALRAFVEEQGIAGKATLLRDEDCLSQAEMALPGWFRQQIIKLRAARFCETENFCNLGADTVLLQPITTADLLRDGFPILNYTSHWLPDAHIRYERSRLNHIGRILQVDPVHARRYTDFIIDLFTFNRDALQGLNAYMEALYGPDPYATLLSGVTANSRRDIFGEWTLYSTYLLDVLKKPVPMRNTYPDFLCQVHSRFGLRRCAFKTKIVHFVGKDFDVDYIKQRIARRNQPLGVSLRVSTAGG